MTDTADVRAALCALATDDAPDSSPSTVVADAVAALDDVHAAAAFVDDGGIPRLRRAIDAADRAGDDATARRGRRALAADAGRSAPSNGVDAPPPTTSTPVTERF